MVLADDLCHHPQTWKGALIMKVHPDHLTSPWIAAGDHRTSRRRRALFSLVGNFKPDGWSPPVSPSAVSFKRNVFWTFPQDPLETFCFITDGSLDQNSYNF